MRLYPTPPRRRNATLAGDLTTLVLILLFAWIGMKVHDGVAELAGLGRGLQDAGTAVSRTSSDATGAVRDGFGRAAGAVQGVPLVGGQVAGALRSAGSGATQPVQRQADKEAARLRAAGVDGERRALRLANLLGWLSFLVPTLLLLSRTLPPRIGQVRRLTLAHDLLADAPEIELARRAAYGLPYAALARHTRDPLGDLAAGRHAPLVAALAEDAGVPLQARR